MQAWSLLVTATTPGSVRSCWVTAALALEQKEIENVS